MRPLAPAFPPDVAAALQRPDGCVSVRYTRPADPSWPPPEHDTLLMSTPYETVLAALVLDTKGSLRFVRTGSRAEGARVARTDVRTLVASGARHWHIVMRWDAETLFVTARDQHAR
jgi:hypothetical protein